MNAQFFTDNEKQLGKKVGRAYISVFKAMGFFFVLSIILSAIAIGNAAPAGSEIRLDPGQSMYLSSFYADNGQEFQFAFAISQENGQDYSYPKHVDGPFEAMQYMDQMDWLVTMQLYRADNLNFENAELVADISGEANIVQMQLAEGFYRMKMTNNHDAQLDIVVGRAHANIGLVIAAGGSWAVFGILVGIFSFMIHIGMWILVIYIIVKVISAANEDSHRRVRYQQQYNQQFNSGIIEPQNYQPQTQQQTTQGPLPHNQQ